jgi:hypothetical protein
MRLPRSAFLSPAAAVLVLAAAAPSLAEQPSKNPWHGFGPGSTVHRKMVTTSSMGAMALPSQTVEMRETVVSATADEVVLKIEQKMGEMPWQGQETKIPLKASPGTDVDAPKEEDLGKDKVTVEGREYECAKKRVVMAAGTTVYWAHEKHGMLKSETTATGAGKTVVQVTRLSVPAKVGERGVTCRETRTSTTGMPGGGEITAVMLTSEEVPGGVVRSEMKTSMQGMVSTGVTETVSFEKK